MIEIFYPRSLNTNFVHKPKAIIEESNKEINFFELVRTSPEFPDASKAKKLHS
jgi:hypothetical protein